MKIFSGMLEKPVQLNQYQYQTPLSNLNRKPQRMRTYFTHRQALVLEMEYRLNEYVSKDIRFRLSNILNIDESKITVWFQNKRARERRKIKAKESLR